MTSKKESDRRYYLKNKERIKARVKEWCEKELQFREDVGKEIERRAQTDNGIRNYPEGCFEYSITRDP